MEPPSMAAELGLPPGFHFVPTDVEVVKFYLLPRILAQPLTPNVIIEDDPLSAPPRALLEKHGRKHEAFFFAASQAMNTKGSRKKRTCVGHGTWQGQGKRKRKKGGEEEGPEVKKKLRVPGGAGKMMEVEWNKYALNFQEHGVQGSTGWVMHEYSITAPPELAQSPERVYCIRFSGHGSNAKKRDAQHRGSDDTEFVHEEEQVNDAEAVAIDTATCSASAAEEGPARNEEEQVDAATCSASAAEVGPALFIDDYPPPPAPQLDVNPNALFIDDYPPAPQLDVNPNPADGAGAVAGYGQDWDLPALEDDDISFMNSLLDLLPNFDFSQ